MCRTSCAAGVEDGAVPLQQRAAPAGALRQPPQPVALQHRRGALPVEGRLLPRRVVIGGAAAVGGGRGGRRAHVEFTQRLRAVHGVGVRLGDVALGVLRAALRPSVVAELRDVGGGAHGVLHPHCPPQRVLETGGGAACRVRLFDFPEQVAGRVDPGARQHGEVRAARLDEDALRLAAQGVVLLLARRPAPVRGGEDGAGGGVRPTFRDLQREASRPQAAQCVEGARRQCAARVLEEGGIAQGVEGDVGGEVEGRPRPRVVGRPGEERGGAVIIHHRLPGAAQVIQLCRRHEAARVLRRRRVAGGGVVVGALFRVRRRAAGEGFRGEDGAVEGVVERLASQVGDAARRLDLGAEISVFVPRRRLAAASGVRH